MRLKIILQSKWFYTILIIFTIIYVFLTTNLITYKSVYSGKEQEFIGIIEKIKETDYGYTLTVKAKERLIVYSKETNFQLGDKVLIKGNLELPKNNTVLNNFNYKEYLYHQKIFYIITATDIKLIKANTNLIYKFKNYLIKYLNSFKSKNFLKSFILGDTSYLGDQLYDSYQLNGICHLLSIGSTHITFFTIICLMIFKKFKLKENLSYILLFSIIFLYLLLTDFPVAIMRVYLYLLLSFLNKKLKLNLMEMN